MDMPIVFTSHVYAEDGSEDGVFNLKSPGLAKLKRGSHETKVVDELEPRAANACSKSTIRPGSATPT